ncbi:hypothetical protein [Stygiolobus caldivivus]|uniref:Uncharacterized protein n=1 Tax=Stygiolobus caldivivus TaxID=2824673 RepID=A0A8D5U4S1_9CREN|nr:hypothetical protein [Stygiolobus caldivivus]BCU68901.1 hypothetical protein KN1_01980 [Stygiolobus caldivivus]
MVSKRQGSERYTWRAIKWYLHGEFSPGVLILVYFVSALITLSYYTPSVKHFQIVLDYITFSSLYTIPMVTALGTSHVARNDDVTVFEVSLFRGWRRVAFARLMSLALWDAVFLVYLAVLDITLLHDDILVLLSFITVLFYESLIMLVSIIGTEGVSYIITFLIAFVLPVLVTFIVSGYVVSHHVSISGYTAYVVFLISPLLGYGDIKSKYIMLNFNVGVYIEVVLSVFTLVLFLYIFEKYYHIKP